MPKSEYEDVEVEELYSVIEVLLEENGKCATDIIMIGDWNRVAGGKSYRHIAGGNREVKSSVVKVKLFLYGPTQAPRPQ
jgi:hypothetical protein